MDGRQGEEEVSIIIIVIIIKITIILITMIMMMKVREGEVGWQQAVVISLQSILYLHCHQVTIIIIIMKIRR